MSDRTLRAGLAGLVLSASLFSSACSSKKPDFIKESPGGFAEISYNKLTSFSFEDHKQFNRSELDRIRYNPHEALEMFGGYRLKSLTHNIAGRWIKGSNIFILEQKNVNISNNFSFIDPVPSGILIPETKDEKGNSFTVHIILDKYWKDKKIKAYSSSAKNLNLNLKKAGDNFLYAKTVLKGIENSFLEVHMDGEGNYPKTVLRLSKRRLSGSDWAEDDHEEKMKDPIYKQITDLGNERLDIAQAIWKYRNKNGRIPGTLEELMPQYIKSFHTDAWDYDPQKGLVLSRFYPELNKF